MSNIIEILPNIPSQSFNITLEGQSIDFSIIWNSRGNYFSANLSRDGEELINGLVLKTGVQLLEPYNFNIGGLFVINATGNKQEMTINNVNTDTFLFHFTEEELADD